MTRVAKMAAEEGKPTLGTDITKDDLDAAAEVGPTETAAPVVEDGGQTLTGPTAKEAAEGKDGSDRSKAAKLAKGKKEAAEQAEKDEQPTYKEVFVVSLSAYQITQQPGHEAARAEYFISPNKPDDPQRAFDDPWLRMNIKAGLLKLAQ